MKTSISGILIFMLGGVCFSFYPMAKAIGDAELAQELTNPIADIVTIPIQINFDNDIGINDEGSKTTTNIQPVIPIELNSDWNLITRTIFPIISQKRLPVRAG